MPPSKGATKKQLTLEVGEVALLVEAGGLETERVDDVVDLDLGILKTLLGLLSGSVGTGVYNGIHVRYGTVSRGIGPMDCFAFAQFSRFLCSYAHMWHTETKAGRKLKLDGVLYAPTVTAPSVIMAQSAS
jgi:hypothetical protein